MNTQIATSSKDSSLLNASHLVCDLKQRETLVREIRCLEGQLSRLKQRSTKASGSVLETYEEMIRSRKDMLDQV